VLDPLKADLAIYFGASEGRGMLQAIAKYSWTFDDSLDWESYLDRATRLCSNGAHEVQYFVQVKFLFPSIQDDTTAPQNTNTNTAPQRRRRRRISLFVFNDTIEGPRAREHQHQTFHTGHERLVRLQHDVWRGLQALLVDQRFRVYKGFRV
jgi:hypothetical protein